MVGSDKTMISEEWHRERSLREAGKIFELILF